MLALLRPRLVLHSSPHLQIRAIKTRPRVIPSYIRTWDPTRLHPVELVVRSDGPSHNPQVDPYAVESPQQDVEGGATGKGTSIPMIPRANNRHAVKRLQYLVHLCASDRHNRSLRAPLWRAYVLAKAADGKLLRRLPDSVWSLLWSFQSVESLEHRKRRACLTQLNRDMCLAGKSMSSAQRVSLIQKIHDAGETRRALEEWRAYMNTEPEYLELGTKLYARIEDLAQARKIMGQLYKLHPSWDTAVMMTVFRAHTGAKNPAQRKFTQEIFSQMKQRLGDDVTIEHYDAWLVGFMEARQMTHAKRVFRHMVTDGYVDIGSSSQAIEETLIRLHMLYRLGTDISKMTSIVLEAISVLPPIYHRHLFGDWMKAAVRYKAPQAAAQILDMMVQKKVAPETYHFNMLLRALIRTKEDPNILKAENIAWSMVDEARKAGPRSRSSLSSTAEFISANIDGDTESLTAPEGTPPADINTFALLVQHHATSHQWEHVDYLTRQLKALSFGPNEIIMNVLIDKKIRQGAYAEAWSMYRSLTEPRSGAPALYPNGASLRMMWKNLRFALGNSGTRGDPGLPSPRELLKETVDWGLRHRSRYDASRFRQGLAGADLGAITALIMHCFSYVQDLPGNLVALHVLRHQFEIFPIPKSKDILIGQMAWVDLSNESNSVNSQYFHSKSNASNTDRIVKVYNVLLQARLKRLEKAGVRAEHLTPEQIGDHALNMLSEFVRVMLKRAHSAGDIEAMIHAAKDSIGLPDLPTGDMNSEEVA